MPLLQATRSLIVILAILSIAACHSPAFYRASPQARLAAEPASEPVDPILTHFELPFTLAWVPPPAQSVAREAEPDDPADLWQTLRGGFRLTDAVAGAARGHPRYTRALRWLESQRNLLHKDTRVQRYLPYLVAEVQSHDMPLEIALLPIVESTLDPYAASPSGAAGLWQLMPATARLYDVPINSWYDGRRDIVDSTEAALAHLARLHERFGDWLLAMAAYNCGEARVKRALARANKRSFWDIELPRETEHYVPRVLALAALIRTPERFEFELPELALSPRFEARDFDAQIDVGALADLADIPIEELFRLNAGLNRRATPPQGPHRLLVPVSHVEQFESAISRYAPKHRRWEEHRVRRGDTLGVIAERHGTTIHAIRAANGIEGHLIRPGDTLRIPPATASTTGFEANPLLTPKARTIAYRVTRGDSLWSISQKFGTTVGWLARLNRLDPRAPLRVGQRIAVPAGRVRA